LKQGDEGRIPERPKDWSAFLAAHAVASEEFMENVEDLPVEERSFFSEIANGVEE
jgi:virulence-associated protein VagC